jgi:hypothetical protein
MAGAAKDGDGGVVAVISKVNVISKWDIRGFVGGNKKVCQGKRRNTRPVVV